MTVRFCWVDIYRLIIHETGPLRAKMLVDALQFPCLPTQSPSGKRVSAVTLQFLMFNFYFLPFHGIFITYRKFLLLIGIFITYRKFFDALYLSFTDFHPPPPTAVSQIYKLR